MKNVHVTVVNDLGKVKSLTRREVGTLQTMLGYLAETLTSMGDGDDWWTPEEKTTHENMCGDLAHLIEIFGVR